VNLAITGITWPISDPFHMVTSFFQGGAQGPRDAGVQQYIHDVGQQMTVCLDSGCYLSPRTRN
jgi:hypothetical protein